MKRMKALSASRDVLGIQAERKQCRSLLDLQNYRLDELQLSDQDINTLRDVQEEVGHSIHMIVRHLDIIIVSNASLFVFVS